MLGSALSLTVFNVIARAAHLIFFLAIGNHFGADAGTDTVFFLFAPLAVIMSVFAGVADAVVMPAMHRALALNCERRMRFALIWRTVVLVPPTTLVALVLTLFVTHGVPMNVTLLLLPIPLLAVLSAIFVGLMNAEGKHKGASLGPLYGAFFSFLPLYLMSPTMTSLALTLLLFEIGRILGLFISLGRSHYSRQDEHENANGLFIWALRGSRWQAVGSFLMALNPLIAVYFARTLGEGAVTSVEYASRLWNLIPLVFSGHLTIAYARMSQLAASNEFEFRSVHNLAAKTGLAGLILCLLSIIIVPGAIELAYGAGKLGVQARAEVVVILKAYLWGAAPFVAGMIYVRAISAQGRAQILTRVAAVTILVNTAILAVLINWLGVAAVGFAASATQIIALLLLIVWFDHENPERHRKN